MRERQLVRVQYMSTFHGTNGMSIKRRYTDAFSLVGSEMLSGDAALLFQPYSGCTGNILSFYPSTSPRSISDPLAINDFFCSPSLPLSALPPFHVQLFMLESLKFFLSDSPFVAICLLSVQTSHGNSHFDSPFHYL